MVVREVETNDAPRTTNDWRPTTFEGIVGSVEFFRDTNFDFLGKKWYFLTFSLIFSVAGVLSMAFWHGIPLGVDFRGGTLVYVKYAQTPDVAAINGQLDRVGLKNHRVQRYGQAANNEVLIALDIQETSEQALDKGKIQIIQALESHAPAGKQDLNSSSSLAKIGRAHV